MSLIYRLTKGSPLTYEELDGNFQFLTGSINVISGSYAKTGSNSFNGNQTINGNIDVKGSGSYAIRSRASNIFGNLLTDTHIFSGSIYLATGSDFYAHGHKQYCYGAFKHVQNITGSSNVSYSINFNTTVENDEIEIVSGSQITFYNEGIYNIQLTAQIKQGPNAAEMYMWVKKNGTNVPYSAIKLSLSTNSYHTITNTIISYMGSNEYLELYWQSDSSNTIIIYETSSIGIPDIPSVLCNIHQIR